MLAAVPEGWVLSGCPSLAKTSDSLAVPGGIWLSCNWATGEAVGSGRGCSFGAVTKIRIRTISVRTPKTAATILVDFFKLIFKATEHYLLSKIIMRRILSWIVNTTPPGVAVVFNANI